MGGGRPLREILGPILTIFLLRNSKIWKNPQTHHPPTKKQFSIFWAQSSLKNHVDTIFGCLDRNGGCYGPFSNFRGGDGGDDSEDDVSDEVDEDISDQNDCTPPCDNQNSDEDDTENTPDDASDEQSNDDIDEYRVDVLGSFLPILYQYDVLNLNRSNRSLSSLIDIASDFFSWS